MAVDIFLKIDGIAGEARDKKHAGEIDIIGWSWGVTSRMGRGGPGTSKTPDVETLQVMKFLDRSSAPLVNALLTNQSIKTAILVCRKAGGAEALEYLKITMTDVRVVAVKPSGVSADDRFTETVLLDFSKVMYSYREQEQSGIGKGWIDTEYDLKRAT